MEIDIDDVPWRDEIVDKRRRIFDKGDYHPAQGTGLPHRGEQGQAAQAYGEMNSLLGARHSSGVHGLPDPGDPPARSRVRAGWRLAAQKSMTQRRHWGGALPAKIVIRQSCGVHVFAGKPNVDLFALPGSKALALAQDDLVAALVLGLVERFVSTLRMAPSRSPSR